MIMEKAFIEISSFEMHMITVFSRGDWRMTVKFTPCFLAPLTTLPASFIKYLIFPYQRQILHFIKWPIKTQKTCSFKNPSQPSLAFKVLAIDKGSLPLIKAWLILSRAVCSFRNYHETDWELNMKRCTLQLKQRPHFIQLNSRQIRWEKWLKKLSTFFFSHGATLTNARLRQFMGGVVWQNVAGGIGTLGVCPVQTVSVAHFQIHSWLVHRQPRIFFFKGE